jgi:hypothetical protein
MDTVPLPAANGRIHSVTVPAEKQVHFSIGELLVQAKADLWAKEVQTGYNATYSWMANQLGHFALGFIPVYVLMWVALASTLVDRIEPWFGGGSLFWAQFIIPVLWLAWFVYKEMGDVKDAVSDAKKQNLFPMDASDVRMDALTAVYFFGSGIIVAATQLAASWHKENHQWYWLPVGVFLGLLLLGLVPANYWLSRKKCFQQADLPYIFRLANFPPKIQDPAPGQAICAILDFASLQGAWRHLIVCGPLQSGKTSLVSAIGTEHTFQKGKVRYLATMDFLQFADLPSDPGSSEDRPLWPWKESNILILDDLDPGLKNGNVVDRATIISHLLGLQSLAELRALRTVWTVADDAQFWQKKLAEVLSTTDAEIGVIQLTHASMPHTKTASIGLA